MIRSSSKQFMNKVKNYVIENIDAEASTPIEALENGLENFKAFYCPYEKEETPQIINALMRFFNTGVTDLSIWYDEHRALLREWFEQTEAEAKKYDNIQVSNKFYYQVSRAFISLCKDYNINIEEV
jgi:glucose-6-phosphate isomerase